MSTGSPAGVELDAKGMRFAICATRWNGEIVDQLLVGAQRALAESGAENVRVYRCAGAFELAPLAARVARKGGIDGIVALGCLIRGGTDHYSLLASETTRALGSLALELGTNPKAVAVAFGVLTCDNEQQAEERRDKGREAALSAVATALTLKGLGEQ